MRDYIRKTPDTTDRHRELTDQLGTLAQGICGIIKHLLDDSGRLTPSEYDRLLDAYRAEMIRFNRLYEELEVLETPKKSPMNKEKRRKLNRENREKIKY